MIPRIARQALPFALVGVGGTAAYLGTYAAVRTVLPPEAGNAVARLAVAVPTTWLQGRLAFASRIPLRRLLVGTAFVLAVTTSVSGAIVAVELSLAAPSDRLAEAAAVLAGQACAIAARFALLRGWLFHPSRPSAPHPRHTPEHRVQKEVQS